MRTLFICLVIVYCSVYITSIKLSPCAKWNRIGTTIAETNIRSELREKIVLPEGIFIDKSRNALYVSDGDFVGRVQLLSLNQSSTQSTIVASGLMYPSKIYVDDDINGSTIYITLPYLNHVEKWIPGAIHGIQIGDSFRSCSGVSVDTDKNVYVSESVQSCISKWSPLTNQTTTVAGQKGSEGSSSSQLHSPAGIYVSRSNGDIYIADTFNNRIQRWPKDGSEGVTVAGSSNGTEGSDKASLYYPNAVWVDEETNVIYIADSFNNRIQRYQSNATEGDTIAGQLVGGSGSDQLNFPNDLTFDNKGNLYVSDKHNNRIQIFTLIDNQPCSPTSTANSSQYNKITNVVVLLIFSVIKLLI